MNDFPSIYDFDTYTEWHKEIKKIMSNRIIPSLENRDDFFKILKTGQNLIVKVEISICILCKTCKPLVYKLLNNLPSNVKMIILDANEHRDVVSYFNIKLFPTFISYKGKDIMDYSVGADENLIRDFFQKVALYDNKKQKALPINWWK